MRLLKTGPYVPGAEKLELIQKWGSDIPAYAILSHTWSTNADDEVLFADVQNGTCSRKPAYVKLWQAMERAKLDGYGWLWIDTCCIDKTSSVELSEAINSMYGYYRDAEKCYAYMADVEFELFERDFKGSRWWRRGWTLQELIAPRALEFFSSEWISLGHKYGMHGVITQITGIESEYLSLALPVEHASIAKRMSWAASRQTTREEDMAYCLIGMFDVNMPMLYGEGGKRAFTRLQEEIMRSNEDQSLFAWVKDGSIDQEASNARSYHGLLADSPQDFKYTGSTKTYTEVGDYNPSAMTARGLRLTLPLTAKDSGISIAALQCPVAARGHSGWLAVYLQKMPSGSNQYARVDCKRLASVSELGMPQEIYVRQHFPSLAVPIFYPYHFFQLRKLVCYSDHRELAGYKIVEARPIVNEAHARIPFAQPQSWSNVPLVYQINKSAGALATALLVRRTHDDESFVLGLGASSDSDFAVGFDVTWAESIKDFSGADLQNSFLPQKAGQFMELEFHKVRVSVEEHVRADQKVYFLDLEIHAFPRPPTAVEMIDDALDAFVGPNKREAKAAFRDKAKRLWLG